MKRGEIYWADLPAPAARRPILVVMRSDAVERLRRIIVAPVTSTIRGIRSEVALGRAEGLRRPSAANCDNLTTIARSIVDPEAVGHLSRMRTHELDAALTFALGIKRSASTRTTS